MGFPCTSLAPYGNINSRLLTPFAFVKSCISHSQSHQLGSLSSPSPTDRCYLSLLTHLFPPAFSGTICSPNNQSVKHLPVQICPRKLPAAITNTCIRHCRVIKTYHVPWYIRHTWLFFSSSIRLQWEVWHYFTDWVQIVLPNQHANVTLEVERTCYWSDNIKKTPWVFPKRGSLPVCFIEKRLSSGLFCPMLNQLTQPAMNSVRKPQQSIINVCVGHRNG